MNTKSWRTTILGILMLIAEVIKILVPLLSGQGFSVNTVDIALVAGGIGLLNARDHRAG